MSLDLANGDTAPYARVWTGGRETCVVDARNHDMNRVESLLVAVESSYVVVLYSLLLVVPPRCLRPRTQNASPAELTPTVRSHVLARHPTTTNVPLLPKPSPAPLAAAIGIVRAVAELAN